MPLAKVGAKLRSGNLPLGKVINVQDIDKSSDLVATGPQIEDQVDRTGYKFLKSKPVSILS